MPGCRQNQCFAVGQQPRAPCFVLFFPPTQAPEYDDGEFGFDREFEVICFIDKASALLCQVETRLNCRSNRLCSVRRKDRNSNGTSGIVSSPSAVVNGGFRVKRP